MGAAASQASYEDTTYQVLVHFSDGGYGMFMYRGYSPFRSSAQVWRYLMAGNVGEIAVMLGAAIVSLSVDLEPPAVRRLCVRAASSAVLSPDGVYRPVARAAALSDCE